MKNLFMLICVTCAQQLAAQPVKMNVKVGDEFRFKMMDTRLAIFGSDEEGFAFMGLTGKGIELDGYDRSLGPSYNKEIDFDSKSPYDRNLGVFHLGKKHYWLYSSFDKSKAECYIYANEVDVKKGTVELVDKPTLVLGQITGIVKDIYKFFARNEDAYTVTASPSKKHLSLSYILKPEREGGELSELTIGVHVFEEGMKPKWEKKFTVSTTARAVVIVNTVTTDEGNVYVLLAHKTKNVVAFEIVYLNRDSEKPIHHKASITSFEEMSNPLFVQQGNKVVLGGVYKDEDSRGMPDGFFTYTYSDGNGTLAKYPFDKNEMLKNEKGNKYKPNGGLAIADLQALEDGSLCIAAEDRLIVGSTSPNSGNQNNTYKYHDYFVARIGPDGQQLWFRKISKKQYSLNFKESVGIKNLDYNNNIVSVYNDNGKNDELEDDGKPSEITMGTSQVVLSDVVIDKSGKMTKNIQDLGKTFIHPVTLYQFSKNGYIGITQMGNRSFAPIRIDLK